MLSPYKAVFFDFDDTLQIRTPTPTMAFIQVVRSMGIEISAATERRLKRWAHYYWGQDDLVQNDKNCLGEEAFWLYYNKQLLQMSQVVDNLTERAQLLIDYFDNQYTPQVELAPGSYTTLVALKNAGYQLGLISNRPQPFHEAVARLGLDGLFDMVLAAGEISCWKPNPAIFSYALSRFENLRAWECLYVGDNYYADGYGAARAGWVPVIFDPENLYGRLSSWHHIKQIDELLEVISYPHTTAPFCQDQVVKKMTPAYSIV